MRHRKILLAAGLAFIGPALGTSPAAAQAARQPASHENSAHTALDEAIRGSARTAAHIARDPFRNPKETLSFFGIRPEMTVVEIAPGRGWYTEILAPYLSDKGTLYAAAPAGRYGDAIATRLQSDPDVFGKVKLVRFPAGPGDPAVPDGSADLVLTFRSAHNWIAEGEETAKKSFQALFAMLKPGGILGLVDHQMPENATAIAEGSSGYVKFSTVRRLAEEAGFRLDAPSDINANPKDKADHPKGVWRLPPTLSLGDEDRDAFLAIGESNRMTVRFIKPE